MMVEQVAVVVESVQSVPWHYVPYDMERMDSAATMHRGRMGWIRFEWVKDGEGIVWVDYLPEKGMPDSTDSIDVTGRRHLTHNISFDRRWTDKYEARVIWNNLIKDGWVVTSRWQRPRPQ